MQMQIFLYKTYYCLVEKKCGITTQMLYYEKPFTVVFEELLSWISDCISEIQQHTEVLCYPGMNLLLSIRTECVYTVLVAHNGFTFDFRILAAEIERRNLKHKLASSDLMFADTLFDLQKVHTP